MRALVFRGPGSIDLAEVPDPEVEAATDALVELEAAGLCGSDLHPYLGREGARPGVVAGHEGVGTVLAVGDGVSAFRRGDRVIVPFSTNCGSCQACAWGLSSRCESGALFGWGNPDDPGHPHVHGMQAERVRVPLADATLVAIPPSMAVETALLLSDNLPTGWYAVARAEPANGSGRLAILGSGSVGVCAAVAAQHLGADSITVIEPIAERRGLVADLLGVETIDPDDDRLLRADRFSSIIDAAGTRASQALAFELATTGAIISMIAVQTEPTFAFTPIDVYDRNLTIRSGRAPVRSLLDTLLPLIERRQLLDPSDRIFTDRALPLSSGSGAYHRFAERAGGLIKAWFDPTL